MIAPQSALWTHGSHLGFGYPLQTSLPSVPVFGQSPATPPLAPLSTSTTATTTTTTTTPSRQNIPVTDPPVPAPRIIVPQQEVNTAQIVEMLHNNHALAAAVRDATQGHVDNSLGTQSGM